MTITLTTSVVEELVVIGDSALVGTREPGRRRNRRPGVVTWEALRDGVAARAGEPGVVRTREALELVRQGGRLAAGDAPAAADRGRGAAGARGDPRVRLATGQALRVDLVWAEAKVAVEYDGDQHRTDRRQWREGVERDAALRAEGWTVIRVTVDVFQEPRWQSFLWQLRTALRSV